MPATAGGSTSGSSTSVIATSRPRKRRLASSHAAGVPTATMIASAIAVVFRLSHSASSDALLPQALEQVGPASVSTKIATTGSVRKTSASAVVAREDDREPAARDHGGAPKPASLERLRARAAAQALDELVRRPRSGPSTTPAPYSTCGSTSAGSGTARSSSAGGGDVGAVDEARRRRRPG